MKSSLCVLAVMFMLAISGCLARGGISGELRTNLDLDLATLHKAVVATLKEEKIVIDENNIDAVTALIKGHYADKTPITIHCELLSSQATTMTIQIGLFGHKARSEALMKQIGLHFPKP